MYKIASNGYIVRVSDNAYIPPDIANRDYREYLLWVEQGGVAELLPPDPAFPNP